MSKQVHLAEWIGSDGKRYVTDDLDVVICRRKHGHDDWTVRPPKPRPAALGFPIGARTR